MTTELTAHDYTIGWICALPKEQTAATAILDHVHDDLPTQQPVDDSNTYTLGSVGPHNIVVCCLPKGQYGNISAATIGNNLSRTFPNVKIGLVVGIGGGIPPKVKLGDVVISTPVDQYPGVIQWDLGKTEDGGTFKRTGALDNPPKSLLTALSKLETNTNLKGSKIPMYLQEVEKKWPRLVPQYTRSAELQDPLSPVVHERETRIHYGLIASGDQVIKDAYTRDRLNESVGGNLLCIEMEAAGLMNSLPCLVIRGICDYADAHKNKEWQEYAATVAAAAAKELLGLVSPSLVDAERPIKDIVGRVLHKLTRTEATIETIRSKLDRKEDLEILDWLTPIDFSPQNNDYIKRRQPGTGQWILDSIEFQSWINMNNQTLFCPGIPGAGKTILASLVIDHLCRRYQSDPTIGIAYIYCNFRQQDDQTVEKLLANLLKQLSRDQSVLPSQVKDIHDQHRVRNTRPSCDEIMKTLCSVASMYSKIFIVIDALDECSGSNGCRPYLLSEIFNFQARTEANILATSRFVQAIEKEFEGCPKLEICASESDIRMYLNGQMPQLFHSPSPALQQEIETEISRTADGMFLLAVLFFDSIKSKPTARKIKLALKALREQSVGPDDVDKSKILDRAYGDAMTRIKDQRTDLLDLAIKVLSWITYSKRPITISELQHALAVESGMTEFDNDNIPEINGILSICAGLVTVDNEGNIVRLVHYTTQEYFERRWTDWFPDPQAYIATVCVTYLSFNAFASRECKNDQQFYERLRSYPLYHYAAQNWGHHSRASLSLGKEMPMILDFLEDDDKVVASSQALMVTKYSQEMYWGLQAEQGITGVHLAAYFGLEETIERLLERGHEPNTKSGDGDTPLSYAAKKGHTAVVKLLLALPNVDPNSHDIYGSTPLHGAGINEHEEVVKMLLATDTVELNAKNRGGYTPLHTTLIKGHIGIVKLLLGTNGVDLNAKENRGWTPLHFAVSQGNEEIVKLLLATEDVDLSSSNALTPLHIAAQNGCESVAKLLLTAEGVDIESKTMAGHTPLTLAAREGHKGMVRLLLAEGADPNITHSWKDKTDYTALHLAVSLKQKGVVELLLAEGADPNLVCSRGEKQNLTALHLALAVRKAKARDIEIVQLLLEGGANTNLLATYNYVGICSLSPLHMAVTCESKATVELLLQRGADIDGRGIWMGQLNSTPLDVARKEGYDEIVELLLQYGAK